MPKRIPLACNQENCGPLLPHCGKRVTYSYRKCRCDLCYEAYSKHSKRHYQKHSDRILAKMREDRAADPEVNRQRCRRYRAGNRDRLLEYDRKRYAYNREDRLAQMRDRYAANPEPVLERVKRYRVENEEQIRIRERARRKRDRVERNARNREWSAKNPEKVREARLRYRKSNAHKIRIDSARRRAIKRAAFVEDVDHIKVFESFGYMCQRCGADCSGSKWPELNSPTIDHIIPLAKGGTHEYANVQLLCYSCNARKRDRIA